MEKRGWKILLHREENSHDGSPMLLRRVGFQSLTGGAVADEIFHSMMVFLFVHDDCCPTLVGRKDDYRVVLFEAF